MVRLKTLGILFLMAFGFMNGPLFAQSADQNAYQNAVNLYNAGEMDQARTAFQDFISNYAGSDYVPEAYVYMARLESDPETSIRYFKQIVDQYPTSTVADDALMGMAQYEYARGNYQESHHLYSRLTNEYPQSELNAEASYWSANSLYMQGEIDAAETAFNHTISTHPTAEKASWALLDLAYIYQQKKDCATATQKYQKLIQEYPNSDVISAAYYRYGECLSEMGQKEEALRAYKMVLDEYPQSFEAAMVRGKELDFSKMGGQASQPAPATSTISEAKDKTPTAQPAQAATTSDGATTYHIQIGAYANADNAQLLRASIEDANTPISIVQVDKGDKVIYRVWVGNYSTRAEAEAAAAKLIKDKGVRNYVIVAE